MAKITKKGTKNMAKNEDNPIVPPEAPAEAATIEQLTAEYPELVEKIVVNAKTEAAKDIAEMPVRKFRAKFASLYEKIATDLTGLVNAADLKIKGFLLEVDDPFAAGAARVFVQQKGLKSARLPIVLPFKDKASRRALESYIQRANGAGDSERANAAGDALEKIK